MNQTRNRWIHFTIVCLLAILIVGSGSLIARADSGSPERMIERAWQTAQEAGSYRFVSDINQTLVPRPVAAMIGQQETALLLSLDGAVVLPDKSYTELKVLNGQRSESLTMLRDGAQSFMLQDGELKPVENVLNLASQSNDLLGYLAAADQVVLLDPPDGHPDLARYSFVINGPRYAEYVRQQAEVAVQSEPGAPRGLTVKPIIALQQLNGHGELWVSPAGLPVRQIVEIRMPEVSPEYDARVRISADFSAFGKVEALPRAVPGLDGSWRLEGSLPSESASELGMFPGFGIRPEKAHTSEPSNLTAVVASWKPSLQVSPTSLILFALIFLVVFFVNFYRRYPQRCYTLFVLVLIPIFVLSPLLESTGVVRFMERQVKAAEARASAVPDLLEALGIDIHAIEASSINDSKSSLVAFEAPQKPDVFSNQMATGASMQINSQEGQLSRCGDGEQGIDTDGDGLTDQVELCLGTNPYLEDTDGDGIPDKVELEGFDLGGKRWVSDPLKPDSNGDGILDTLEWAAALTANGQAANPDLDGDGIPNLWDDDDDGDGVPDGQDLSPFAVTDYTTVANLSLSGGGGFNGHKTIKIQVQPMNKDHLRYSTTALDWPQDSKGNIKDLDDWNSREDLRLNPFLLVTTNVTPDENLAKKYGFRTYIKDGQTILLVPLAPVQTGGAVHSFFGKVAYAPGEGAELQWQAQMVWMAEMQVDRYEGWMLKTETQLVHQYQDSFRITGLEVTKEAGYEAAVLGTPDQLDDLYLFKVLLGLNDTFKTHFALEGQGSGETALREIAQRFAPNSTASLTHTFGVPPEYVSMSGPVRYGLVDEGLIRLGSELIPGFLQDENNARFYNDETRCQDAYGNKVSCASLLVAYEQTSGSLDLADLVGGNSLIVDPSQMHVNLADIPLLTMRGVQLRMYEQGRSGWQMVSAARMLELIEQRYAADYDTAMRALFPDLQSNHLRFVTYAAYLWAASPSYNPIAIDGRTIVAGLANEAELHANRTLAPELEAQAGTAVNYFGLGSGLFSALFGTGSGNVWSINDLITFGKEFKSLNALSAFEGVGGGLFVVSTVTATVMGALLAVCASAPDLDMCTKGADALKAANIAVSALGVISQAQTVVSLIIQYATNTLKEISNLVMTVQFVGMAVSVTMVWVSFALTLINGGLNDPVTWRMALALAIVTTIYLLVVFFLNFIPIVGQIITAILALIDAIFSFISLLTGQSISVATIILAIFYGAKVLTNVGEAVFGAFSTTLSDPEGGLVGGSTLVVSAPFQGTIVKENRNSDGKPRNPNEVKATDDDLRKSSVSGQLTWDYPYYKTEELAAIFPGQDKGGQVDCQLEGEIMYCSNTAALGFALTPRINGLAPIAARTNYTIVWAETGGAGSWRWSTKTWDGFAPEEADLLKPEFMVLDILPVTVTELWNWSALTNHDLDGDGLTNEQEAILGTSPTNWDTDGDGLSDYYEIQIGSDPLKWDTDGDGLSDSLELRLGTLFNVADTDGDGLLDGEEVRRLENGVMVGGWQVTMPDGAAFWVSSDPLQADADGDGLNDAEEKANGLSPYAANPAVPALSLSVAPVRGVPSGRMGAYWLPNETVEIQVRLSNGSPEAVSTTLTLDLPAWLTSVQGGAMQGDRTPVLSRNSNQLSWSFSGANALQSYESVSTTVTAHTTGSSGQGEIVLSLPFAGLQLRKTFSAVLDGDNPTLAILAPADGAYLRGTHYVVGGTASDPTTWIVEQGLSITPQGSEPSYQPIPISQGPWAFTWELPTTDGRYLLQARAADVMGHQATAGPVSVIIDNTPPSLSLAYEMLGGQVRLSGTATDNLAGVHGVQISLNGQPWRSLTLEGSSWSYDWTMGEGAQGKHQVLARAFDNAGNESAVQRLDFTVDSVAPSSIVNAGADHDAPPAVKPNTSFTISGVADEGGRLPQPATAADLRSGMDVFDDSAIWLGLSSIHDNDGGVLAAWIGDFNADRLSDLAVGLPGPEGDEGFVSVLYGRAGGWPVLPDLEMLATSPMRFIGAVGSRLGSLLAPAGDVNGDNMDDLLIGERGSRRAFLIFGNLRPLGEVTLDSGLSAYRVMLQAPDTITGLAAAGDVNGDGSGDLLIHTGNKAYLVLGRFGPWPETLDLAAEAAAVFSGVTGALGVGDVDNDQLAEWVTLANKTISLYGWNTSAAGPVLLKTFTTADSDPRAAALGYVNADGYADWIYSDGSNRVLVYGSGASTHTFSGYDGFFAAPGDVNGDGWADILLSNAAGLASLVGQPSGGSPTVLATIAGVGGAANAPYATGADLNSDGSADLLLIPSLAAAEGRGFDAPNFSSGFISPQTLPLGASTTTLTGTFSLSTEDMRAPLGEMRTMLLSTTSDTRYVDDDPGGCDGNIPCYQTIQQAVNASDGGGDTIVVYPGTYASFIIPAGSSYDHLTVRGVNADAVFVEGGAGDAIKVAADGVSLSNLTVRNAANGIVLEFSAGEPPASGGSAISIDHVLVHSVQKPISMSEAAALNLSDSTLVGNAANPLVSVDSSNSIHSWSNVTAAPAAIGANGALVTAGGALYALPGNSNSTIYQAVPQSTGALGSWTQPFSLHHPLPTNTGTTPEIQGTNLLVGGTDTISQLHSNFHWPNLGGLANDRIEALAIHPSTGHVYAGGFFTSIGGVSAANIARWDGTAWHSLGSGVENGANGTVLALAFDTAGNLYLGGEFTKAGTKDAGHVAGWNGSSWFVLGTEGKWTSDYGTVFIFNGVDGPVNDVVYDTVSNKVFIGGHFSRTYEWGSATEGLNSKESPNLASWTPGCIPSKTSTCYQTFPYLNVNGPVNALALGGSGSGRKLYVGGSFTSVGNPSLSAKNIASYNTTTTNNSNAWAILGTGLDNPVRDIAVGPQGQLYAASNGTSTQAVWQWNGSTWFLPGGHTSEASALAVDAWGNVYTGDNLGRIQIQLGGAGAFQHMANYHNFPTTPGGWTFSARDLVVDGAGQLYGASSGYDYYNRRWYGALHRWAPASFYQRPLTGGGWTRRAYPPTPSMWDAPAAVVAAGGEDLYAIWGSYASGVLYYYSSASNTWTQKSSPNTALTLKHLVWAGDRLYALGYASSGSWSLTRYDPAANSWTSLAAPTVPYASNSGAGLSWAWDGANHIYLQPGDGTNNFARYSLSANSWENLPAPSVSFTISNGPAMARIGSYLYVYGTPASGTNNLFRYGSLPASDLRLTVRRTAFVKPDSAASFNWVSLTSAAGSYRFRTDIDSSNAWIAPSSASWTPALPSGATRLTSTQAAFTAPQDGLYRLGPGSLLNAGYHRYKAVAYVYPSQAACTACGSGALTWGVDAFATVRQAVESGAARVLIHPGRYPQTFYLVSGVEVMGSGAELTIIEPPPGLTSGTLVTAEGVAGASLARLTLAGGSQWEGFLAEGGAKGLKLTRCILRDLKTGVRLRGGSEVEIVNNTLVSNTDAVIIEGTTPVNLRNTIFAYNSGTGLRHGDSPTSLSNTYNNFWANGADMNPSGVSLGSLFFDPRFRSLAHKDLRLAAGSPLIDRGAPNDPTPPGGGRVDIGYAEYNAAGFYVSKNYSETGMNDGLVWGIDAFDRIQPALDAAAAALRGLLGAVPEGGYSVAVDAGSYTERVRVPSHVWLVGSGAQVTTIDAGSAGSPVIFEGVISSGLSGFTLLNASASGAGVEIKGVSSGLTIERNVIRSSASHGVSLAGSSSATVVFNTIVGNGQAGVYATGSGTWAWVSNNILHGNLRGLKAEAGGLVLNSYNLLDNTTNFSGVTAGEGALLAAPAFAESSYYVPSAASPAIDAADPLAPVPAAGGLRADLGYKELIASPLTVVLGPQIDSNVTGNSGVAKVEVGVSLVSDATQSVTDTLPETWQTLTPTQTGQPLFYWTHNLNLATPGLYRVYSRATDAAGNVETEALDWYEGGFVIDNTPPTVSWGSPALPGSTSAAAVLAKAQFSGTVTTGSGTRDDVVRTEFNVSGPGGTASYTAEGGRAWIPLPLTGRYTINAVAVDEAGNQASQSATVDVIGSSSVAAVTSHAANGAVNSAAVNLRGYVRFTSTGAGAVSVSVSGGATIQATLDEPGAQFSAWSAAISLPAGEGTKTVTVTPSLGGTSGAPTTVNLVLDTTAPSLSIESPAAGASVVQTAIFSGTATDSGSALQRVEVSVDGGYTWRQAEISGSAWSLEWDLGPGQDYASYPARVRAVDTAGNQTLAVRTVTVDSLPPTQLAPVSFSEPVGQHLEQGASLTIEWNTPIDAGGVSHVLLAVDKNADTMPTSVASGNSQTASLNSPGEWYVHLAAQDASGNQVLYHNGPWYVRNLQAAGFTERRHSIVLDGKIDLERGEWQATDLLGMDARSGHPQELYLSLDGQYIFLGWSGAWWTLDGTLWAYLDAAPGGSNTGIEGNLLSFPADLAVEIRGPGEGQLWTWNGGWVSNTLDFFNGPSGDTEVRVPWTPSASQSLNMVAFALPRVAENVEVVQSLASAQEQQLAHNMGSVLAMTGQVGLLQAGTGAAPWAAFPTTNSLDETLTENFVWSPADLSDLAQINHNQPSARTVYMSVSSSMANSQAACPERYIIYYIQLENPEPTPISGLSLTLTPSGLSYKSVSGATLASGGASWTLNAPDLAPGARALVTIAALTDSNLNGKLEVASDIRLSAGGTLLTPESNAEVRFAHRADGQAPVVSFDVLPGSAIRPGLHTFTGSANDTGADGAPGSGVGSVQVALGDPVWMYTVGTLAWSIPIEIEPGTTALTLEARAIDHCGNTSSPVTQHTFIVDGTPPVVTWSAPDVITGSLAVLSGSVYDPAPVGGLVQRVEVQIDEAGPWRTAQGPFAPQNGQQGWVWNWPVMQEDGVEHNLRVRATDAVGNTTVTGWQPVVVDTLAPQLTVNPAPPEQGHGPVLSGSVSDGSGVQAVQILVYDAEGEAFIQQALLEGDTWSFTPAGVRWTMGTYTLRVQALDNYGNMRMMGPYPYQHVGTPAPVLADISPAAAKAGSDGLILAVTGSGFVSTSVVRWNGEDLTTTFTSDTELAAAIPAGRLETVSTNQVTVFTPAPGGGTSTVLAFYVTYAQVDVFEQMVASGLNPSASAGPAAVSATGEGLLAVAQFDGNPGSELDFADHDAYFDVYAGPENSFEQVTIVTCDLFSGDKLYWWDAAALQWQLADNQIYADGCVTAVVTGDSSPSLARLQGTYFATGAESLPTVQLTSSQNPSVFGQPLELTAQVSGGYGMPSGSVTFRDGDLVLSGCEDVVLELGNASCEVSAFVAGTHLLAVEYSGNAVYRSSSASLEQVVGKADATLTLSDLDYDYDGTLKHATLTIDPPGLSGVMVTYNGEQALPKDAGSYTVVAALDNPNYQAESVSDTLIIHHIPLTVRADDKGREYLEDNPDFSVSFSGFAGGEGAEVLSGEPLLSTNAMLDSPAGDYTIIVEVGTLSAQNYVFEFVDGKLTIGPTDQVITFDPLLDRTYGDPDFEVSATASSGLQVSFSAEGDCTIEENVGQITRAGSCTITARQNGDANFRAAIPVPQTFFINKALASIMLEKLIQEYDGEVKEVTVTTVPVEVGVLVTYAGSTELPVNAGSYAVVATINDPNYLGEPADGILVIIPRPVTVTAINQTKIYGEGDPDLTYVVTGEPLVAGDDFTGELEREPGEDAGEYPIQLGTLSAGDNYDLTFVEGRLTITKAVLNVRADNKTRQYSDLDPDFTYTISGFKYGESGVSGSADCNTSATPLSPPGDYDITCTTGSLSASNYSFRFENGTLIIGKEKATLTYTGDMQVTTSKANAKATVTLAAVLEEEQDGSLGDHLNGQQVRFNVLNHGGSVVDSCIATIGNVTNGKGYGSCTISLGASDPYQVHFNLVNNHYYVAEEEDVAILVNDPGTGMTAGGGWLVDPNIGSRVSFGFTAKFLKNGKVQGNSLFIYRVTTDLSELVPGAPEGLREYNWIIKSNAMQGLNVYDCPAGAKIGCKATITGKNNIQAVDRLTGVTYSLGGNYQFQVDVYDNREVNSPPSDKADQYAIRVWNASGVYYMLGDGYDANWRLKPLEINGGNILVKDK
jgi:hypothetical protein